MTWQQTPPPLGSPPAQPVLPLHLDQYGAALQAQRDQEHMRLLALFHYIGGGLIMFFSSIPIIHLVIGIVMLTHPQVFAPATTQSAGGSPDFPTQLAGWMFTIIGGTVVLLGWTVGLLTIYSGRCLGRRRHRTFSFIVAILLLLWMPIGTALGVFTILVLQRESVKASYA